MKSALLIIDMLKDYLLPEGLAYCEKCREIITPISNCIDHARSNEIPIFYVNTCLVDPNNPLARKWGYHAVEGTEGAQVVKELSPSPENDFIINKESYSGFFRTSLDTQLRSQGVEHLVLTGIHTHVCVLLTGVDAFSLGYQVTTLEDSISTGYEPNHESRLRFFNSHIGELSRSETWIKGK